MEIEIVNGGGVLNIKLRGYIRVLEVSLEIIQREPALVEGKID